MEKYRFKVGTYEVDFDRILKENMDAGGLAFIVIGPNNALVAVSNRVLETIRGSGHVEIRRLSWFGKALYMPETQLLVAWSPRSNIVPFSYAPIPLEKVEAISEKVEAVVVAYAKAQVVIKVLMFK
jgi:hypothetical protein